MKLLYLGQHVDCIASGADQVNKRNQLLLKAIFRGQLIYVEPHMRGLLDKLVFGVNRKLITDVKKELDKGVYTHMFIAQSLMGRISKFVKKNYPSVVIITFYHNIEVQYAYEYFKTSGLRALPFYLAVKWWEKIGSKYSDKFITLNRRDSDLLKKKYGKDATIELPTSFDDRFDLERAIEIAKDENRSPIDYLFVGVAFFANIQGVQWFIDNVMPYVNGNLYVVGKGMDKVIFKNLTPNIHICGFVEDLADFYYRARMVVSPIFVGGGMKTKTAEALMYGKSIVGTKEAFEGYQLDSRCMYTCTTPDDFIQTVTSMHDCQKLNLFSRSIYNEYYSTDAVLGTLKNIFNE